MEQLTFSQLEQFLKESTDGSKDGSKVSVYLPMEKAGAQTRQNPIRWGNAVQEVEKILNSEKDFNVDLKSYLKEAKSLEGDHDFWQNQQQGFGFLFGENSGYYVPLHHTPLEQVQVSSCYQVLPLLKEYQQRFQVHLLVLSQGSIRLFQVSIDQITELDLGETPRSIQEALALHVHEKNLQHHNLTSAGGEGRAATHGYADWIDDKQKETAFFMYEVRRGVEDILSKREKIPLVIAGVKEMIDLYQEVSKREDVLEVPGNKDQATPSELHTFVKEDIFPSIFSSQLEEVLQEYAKYAQTPRSSDSLPEIARAALEGRIQHLFVATDQPLWGKYVAETDEVQEEKQATPENCDMYSWVAEQAFLSNAQVWVVDPERVQLETPVAALFRW